jgi:hypothetical protein
MRVLYALLHIQVKQQIFSYKFAEYSKNLLTVEQFVDLVDAAGRPDDTVRAG